VLAVIAARSFSISALGFRTSLHPEVLRTCTLTLTFAGSALTALISLSLVVRMALSAGQPRDCAV
jgi:hypothetical protein